MGRERGSYLSQSYAFYLSLRGPAGYAIPRYQQRIRG